MGSTITKFSDAVYHRQENYDFGVTEFTRRELQLLLTIDGIKSVSEISALLSQDYASLMPDFAKLVRLGLIQTEDNIISTEMTDLIFNESDDTSTVEYTIARMPTGFTA